MGNLFGSLVSQPEYRVYCRSNRDSGSTFSVKVNINTNVGEALRLIDRYLLEHKVKSLGIGAQMLVFDGRVVAESVSLMTLLDPSDELLDQFRLNTDQTALRFVDNFTTRWVKVVVDDFNATREFDGSPFEVRCKADESVSMLVASIRSQQSVTSDTVHYGNGVARVLQPGTNLPVNDDEFVVNIPAGHAISAPIHFHESYTPVPGPFSDQVATAYYRMVRSGTTSSERSARGKEEARSFLVGLNATSGGI